MTSNIIDQVAFCPLSRKIRFEFTVSANSRFTPFIDLRRLRNERQLLGSGREPLTDRNGRAKRSLRESEKVYVEACKVAYSNPNDETGYGGGAKRHTETISECRYR